MKFFFLITIAFFVTKEINAQHNINKPDTLFILYVDPNDTLKSLENLQLNFRNSILHPITNALGRVVFSVNDTRDLDEKSISRLIPIDTLAMIPYDFYSLCKEVITQPNGVKKSSTCFQLSNFTLNNIFQYANCDTLYLKFRSNRQ